RLASLSIEEAVHLGHRSVTEDDIRAATRLFSAEKIEDLASELQHRYPGIDRVVRRMIGWPKEFPVSRFHDLAIQLGLDVEERTPEVSKCTWAGGFTENPLGLAAVLLEVGVLQYKAKRDSAPEIFDAARHDIRADGAHVAISPVYVSALG